MVLRVDADPDSHPDVPVIRQRFWPQRINFKPRRHHHRAFDNGRLGDKALTDEQPDYECQESCTYVEIQLALDIHVVRRSNRRSYLVFQRLARDRSTILSLLNYFFGAALLGSSAAFT